jgi:hypothetical protein
LFSLYDVFSRELLFKNIDLIYCVAGYGVEYDFKALITTLPILEKSIKKMKRFVDLCTLSQQARLYS